MSSGSHNTCRWLLSASAFVGVLLLCIFFSSASTHAATGINQQINFEGRLLNSNGATVPDGIYNIEFKIYQDGDGLTAGDTTPSGSPGTLKWTEDYLVSSSQGVTVKNGYFSVQLGSLNPFGSSINWNQDTLWLSLNIGGTTSGSYPGIGDGEMLPMKRLSANAYSLNSGELGGLTSGQFVQLAQGLQTDASTSTNSIYINKTGTGNIVDLQSSGTDSFMVNNTGDLTFGTNANHTLSVATAGSGIAGKSLTVTAGAAGSGGSALTGGSLLLQGGNGGGTNGNGGNITIDAGVHSGSGTDGTINIGTNNASAITLGNTTNNIATTVNGTAVVKPTSGHDTTTAFQVQNAAGTATVFNVDTTDSQVQLRNLNDTAPTGSELFTSTYSLTNPTTGWTLISGTSSSATATHTNGGGTTSITSNPAFPTVTSTIYQITYTVSGMTQGSIKSKIGGNTGATVTANGTQVDIITSGGTGNLQFVPSSIFDGAITGISVKIISNPQTPALIVKDSTGATASELRVSTAANGNLGLGLNALSYDVSGQFNVAIGENSQSTSAANSFNTSVGYNTLQSNAANDNSAFGYTSLANNTTGQLQTAFGYESLNADTTGSGNSAFGANSLLNVTTGSDNVGSGNATLRDITVGSFNTGIGYQAGYEGTQSDFMTVNNLTNANMFGNHSQATCNNCVILGGQGSDATTYGLGTPNPTNFVSAEPLQYNGSGTTTVATTNTSATVTGTNTNFTSAMIGSEIYIASGLTTTATYKGTISAVTSTTSITVSPAVGFTVSGAHFYVLYIGLQESTTGQIGIGTLAPNAADTLDVVGDINTSTQYKIGGTVICTSSGCTPAAGSSNYIQLQAGTPGTTQSGNFNINTGTGILGTLQAPAATGLTISGNAATSLSTSSGNLTIQAGSGSSVTLGSTTSLIAGGALTITPASALTLNSTTTSTITLDSGTTGAVNIGTGNNSKTIQIGAANNGITDTIGIGNNANAAGVSTVTIGSNNSSSSLLLQSGTGNLTLTTQGTGTLGIGNNAAAQTIAIGNTTSGTTVSIQAGTGGIAVGANTTVSANLVVTNAGNAAFQKGTDFATTGSSNNVNFGTASLYRLTGTSTQTITGIANGADGRILTLVNAASQPATISNLNAGSSASNQIVTGTGADLSLAAGGAVTLVYDSGANQWRVDGAVASTGNYVLLQGSTPGTSQLGNFNINGTGIAATLEASTFDTASGVNLNIGTSNATGINVGTNAASHAIAIGNNSGSTSVTIDCGTGNCNFGTTATAHSTTLGSTNSTATTTLQGGTGGVNIGTGGIANSIQIGNITGAVSQSIFLGNNTTASSTNNVTIGSTIAGTVLLQGSGISESITNSSLIIKTTANATAAFQIQDNSSNGVLTADTTNDKVLFGTSGSVNASLVLNTSNASGYAVTLNTSASTTSSYMLTLPTKAPTAGLCLETSAASATQLSFVGCENNNASITEVAEWDTSGSSSTINLTDSPVNIGDVIVVGTHTSAASAITVSGISGGGVTTWTKIVANNGNATVHRTELWMGTVTSTGSGTIAVTYTGGTPSSAEVTATEFTAAGVTSSTTWGVDTSGGQLNTTSSATVTYPNLLSVNSSEAYVGYAQVQNTPALSGSSSGFSYIVTTAQSNVIAYDTSTAPDTSYQPTANQNSSGQSNTVGAIITAFLSGTAINNSTSVQQANFYVQAATSGTIAGVLQANSGGTADILDARNGSGINVATIGNTGAAVFEDSSNSATAFQVQNQSGNNVLGVDTSVGQAVLGTSSALTGALQFKNSNNNYTVTLNSAASASTTGSYTLTLPVNAPATGLCLESGPTTASQLIFVGCANSNASISEVAEWDTSGSSSPINLSDSPSNVGDVIVVGVQTSSASTITVSGISGGGVTSWTKVVVKNGDANVHRVELWMGTVTASGSGTIATSFAGGTPASAEVTATEFTAAGVTSNTNWGVDTSGGNLNSTSSATVTYPNLTSVNSNEAYIGYAQVQHTPASAGSSSGFAYKVTTTQSNVITYNVATSAGTAYTPTATQNSSGESNTVALLLTAFLSSSAIDNSTTMQQANFYVQAATSGSVAGILQANASGTADIFDARNASGTNVVTIGNTGAVLFENSTNSAAALQVQNQSNLALFTVNTSSSIIQVGSSTSNNNTTVFALNNNDGTATPTEVDGGMYYNNSTSQFLCGENGFWVNCGVPPRDHSYDLYDEFMSGNSGSLATGAYGIGGLNWYNSLIGVPGSLTYNNNQVGGNAPAASADRPGIIDIEQTGTGNGTGQTMSLGLGSMQLGTSRIDYKTAVNITGSNLTVLAGLDNETTASTAPTTGVYWKEAGNGTWQYCYINATPAETCANSAVTATAGTWARLEIIIVSSSEIDFYINGTKIAVTGITYNTTNKVAPAYTSYKSTGTPGTLDVYIDYFELLGTTSSAR